MTDAILTNRLSSKFSDLDFQRDTFRGEFTLTIPIDRLMEVLEFLKADPELQFAFLVYLTCIDYLDRDR